MTKKAIGMMISDRLVLAATCSTVRVVTGAQWQSVFRYSDRLIR